jgi:hypothetical protein
VWFAGSAVDADGDQTNEGDGVTDYGRMIPGPNKADDALKTTAGCSSVAAERGSGASWWCIVIALLLGRSRRQRNGGAHGSR